MKVINVALILASLLAGFVMAEVVTRIVRGAPIPLPLPQVRYVPDSVRRFTLLAPQHGFTRYAPEYVDSSGFRENGAPCDRGHAALAFALGDSFTFGLGVSDSETWPSRLEQDLRRRGDDVCVVNGGTISYGAFQEMSLFLDRGIATHPRLVIHALYWNDYQSASAPKPGEASVLTRDGYFKWDVPAPQQSAPVRVKGWLVHHSALLTLIANAIHRLRQDELAGGYGAAYEKLKTGELSADHWAPVERFYERLRELADSAHFRILVVLLPVSGIVKGPHPLRNPYRLYMRSMLDSLHLRYVDAFQLWSSDSLGENTFLNRGPDAHLSKLGYQVLAKAIADTVTVNDLLRPPD